MATNSYYIYLASARKVYPSRKHTYIILTPLNPTFIYLQGYTLFFLFLLKNIDCGYALERPRRGGSNEYHNLCFEQKYEKYQNFLSENFHFLAVKFSIYLNRRVFVMQRQFSFSVGSIF